MSPHNINKRQRKLQEWLTSILQDPELCQDSKVQEFLQKNREEIVHLDIIEYLGFLYNNPKQKVWVSLRNGIIYKYKDYKAKHPYKYHDVRGGEIGVLSYTELDKLPTKFPKNLSVFYVNDSAKQHLYACESQLDLAKWIEAFKDNKVTLNNSAKVFIPKESNNVKSEKEQVEDSQGDSGKRNTSDSSSSDEVDFKGDFGGSSDKLQDEKARQRVIIGKVPPDVFGSFF